MECWKQIWSPVTGTQLQLAIFLWNIFFFLFVACLFSAYPRKRLVFGFSISVGNRFTLLFPCSFSAVQFCWSGCCTLNPHDCQDVYASGHNTSGVYTICPYGLASCTEAYCDFDTDGGGWTVRMLTLITQYKNFTKNPWNRQLFIIFIYKHDEFSTQFRLL